MWLIEGPADVFDLDAWENHLADLKAWSEQGPEIDQAIKDAKWNIAVLKGEIKSRLTDEQLAAFKDRIQKTR